MKVSLVERDSKLNELQEMILQKQNYLIKKRKEIKDKKEINDLLSHVENDYISYFQFIKNEKEKQIQSLKIINQYLEELTKNGKMLDYEYELIKKDQNQILNEISTISKEMGNLVSL